MRYVRALAFVSAHEGWDREAKQEETADWKAIIGYHD